MKFNWQKIYMKDSEGAMCGVARSRVYGGWLVKDLTYLSTQVVATMVFIPDPQHEWEIEVE